MQVQNDHDLLTRIDANLTNFMGEFEEHIVDDKVQHKEHAARLKSLEQGYWKAVGVISTVMVVTGIIIKFIN